jgi:hypothetical protein
MQGYEFAVLILAIAFGLLFGAIVGAIAKKIGASDRLAGNIATAVLCITVVAVELSFHHAAIELLLN